MKINKKLLLYLLIIVHVAFALIYTFTIGEQLRYPDEIEYIQIAKNLTNSGVFSIDGQNPSAYRPPLYPLFIAIPYYLTSNVLSIKFIQLIVYYLSCLLIFRITVQITSNNKTGLLASIIYLFYPTIFYTANTLYPQTLIMFLLLLLIRFVIKERTDWKEVLGISVLCGLLILLVPIVILFLPFIFYLIFKKSIPNGYRNVFIGLLMMFVILLPWGIRNYQIYQTFTISTNGGISFLLGNNPHTTPNSGVNVDLSGIVDQEKLVILNEAQRDQYYKKLAIGFITTDPVYYTGLFLRKLINYFNYRNELYTKSEKSFLKELVVLITWGSLLLISIIGLFFKQIQTTQNYVLYLFFLQSALFYSIFFTRIRFRIPFVALLIIIAAQTLMIIYNNTISNVRKSNL